MNPPVADGVTAPAQWYLGISGNLLPGKGIGIVSIEPDSPAALAGLTPGIVMTSCNGVSIVDEVSLNETIAASGGILELLLLNAIEGPSIAATVNMRQQATFAFYKTDRRHCQPASARLSYESRACSCAIS